MGDEYRSWHVDVRLVESGSPECDLTPKGEASSLSICSDVQDSFIHFTHFLNIPPPPSSDDVVANGWLNTFLGHVGKCKVCCNYTCIADPQRPEIICRFSWDDWNSIDWIALAVDQVCCYSLSAEQEKHLEFVHAVEKRIMRSESLVYWDLVNELSADSDKVVIISYADRDHQSQVLGEGISIVRRLADGFLDSGRQMACNKRLQFATEELLKDIIAGEPFDIALGKTLREAQLREARVIWLHNALKSDVTDTLKDLPPDSSLIIHLIGHGTRQGLQIHDSKLGNSLRAKDLKEDPNWRWRRVKLLYLSFSCGSGPTTALIGGQRGGFLHQLLRASPLIAAIVCFRWALRREIIRTISEKFCEEYLRERHLPPNASQSLFKAMKGAYDQWKGEEDIHDWRYYCAWAAPMLITQDKAI